MDIEARYREQEKGLERKLDSWQQSLIAIGAALGVGLFLGSGVTIGLAGPAVLLTYVISAAVALILGFTLGEMASVYPVAGSFGIYAERYINPWAGYAMRVTYWFAHMLAIGAQMTAVGVYFGFWFPDVPSWIWILTASMLLVAANATHVGLFGNVESYLSLIKIGAIAAFVLLGGALLAGWGLGGNGAGIGFENLTAHGGFAPNGLRGIWLSSTLVLTSYICVEGVAVTAGEAKNPEVTVPRAVVGVATGLIVIYGLAMLVIVSITPWNALSETSGTLSGSPFVKVFEQVGVPYAGSLMNFVVISAALTSANALLFWCSRMLFSLSRSGHLPKSIGVLNHRGVPVRALGVSTLGMLVAILLALKGEQAFLPLLGTAVAAMLSMWIVIFVCHLRFRRELSVEKQESLRIKVPGHPLPAIFAMAVVAGGMAATPFVAGLEWTVPMFLVWLLAISILYLFRSKPNGSSLM